MRCLRRGMASLGDKAFRKLEGRNQIWERREPYTPKEPGEAARGMVVSRNYVREEGAKGQKKKNIRGLGKRPSQGGRGEERASMLKSEKCRENQGKKVR